MGTIVIRKGLEEGQSQKSRWYANAEEAEQAAAGWRAQGQEVQVITADQHRRGWLYAVRRWLGPRH